MTSNMTNNADIIALIIGALNSEAEQAAADAAALEEFGGDPGAARYVSSALYGIAERLVAATAPDPEPYVGFSGRRYSIEAVSWASLEDGPVTFEPRDTYGPTEDQR